MRKVKLKGKAASLIRKHMYTIYSKWVQPDSSIPPGSFVSFALEEDIIGYGFYEKLGAVGGRIIAYRSEAPSEDLEEIIEWRLLKAYKLRERGGEKKEKGYRLIYADSDGMPGLIADVYNDTTVIQSTSLGWDRNADLIAEKISALGLTSKVFLKNDQRARKRLGLPIERRFLKGGPPTRTVIREDGTSLIVDYGLGHKTGFYLDQREARLRIARMKLDGIEVLDLFSYTGAFSIQAIKAGADSALLVEENKDAVNLAKENFRLNGYKMNYQIIRGRVERVLDSLSAKKKRFGLVVIDPPSFIPSPEYRERGLRAYSKLFGKAFDVAEPEGYIYASSCSYHLGRDELLALLQGSAEKRGYDLRVIYEHTPFNSTPYTRFQDEDLRYLKGFLIQVV